MRDQVIGQPDVGSLALAEPTRHVRRGWIIGLTLASLGMWMAAQTPLQVMLALQLQDITPRHKIVALGVVTGVGAISSALATPVVGALSDRTAPGGRLGRFSGRRHRWTLAMAVLAAACMVLLAKQATVLGVALLWFAFSAFQNGEYATLSAAIPDHVPVRQRATVAGWVGGHHQHRHRLPGRHRRGDRGAPRLAGRLPGPIRGDRGGGHRGLGLGLADQERPLTDRGHAERCPLSAHRRRGPLPVARLTQRVNSCPGRTSPPGRRTGRRSRR